MMGSSEQNTSPREPRAKSTLACVDSARRVVLSFVGAIFEPRCAWLTLALPMPVLGLGLHGMMDDDRGPHIGGPQCCNLHTRRRRFHDWQPLQMAAMLQSFSGHPLMRGLMFPSG